ncbi:hypothetical protein BDQ17DRAFT_1360818 [Cyathus striatus]|nr:hypothetical protein BDQ17DRAFT_1360818 [Cyathus striatus]
MYTCPLSNNTSTFETPRLPLHVSFSIAVPIQYKNDLSSGETAAFPLSSVPHTFEARLPKDGNEFSSEETWRKAEELGIAVASGTAAIVAGTAWALGSIPFFGRSPAALAGAGMAWNNAHTYGAKYGTCGDGTVLKVDHLLIPFHDKFYEIKKEENRFALVDHDG